MSFVPKTSQEEILKRLEGRQYEDLELLADLEKNILRHRDHIISPLKEGENVILLLSGGLDSTVLWKLLLKYYKVNVYPFYLIQHFNLAERLSIWHYGRQLSSYKNYRKPYFQRAKTNFKFAAKKVSELMPELALKCFAPKIGEILRPSSGKNFLSVLYAGYYRMQLWWNQGLKINKIISAVTADDGQEIYTQTHTFSRQLMLNLTSMLADDSVEYFAFGLEKELGHFLGKGDYIALGRKIGLDISRTHSCYKSKILNCGVCQECLWRRSLFKKNQIKDQTFYFQTWLKTLPSLTSFYKYCIVKLKKLIKGVYEKIY